MASEKYSQAFDELMAAYNRPFASGEDKYRELELVFRKVCREICPDYPASDYGSADSGKLHEFNAAGSAAIYNHSLAAQQTGRAQAAVS